MKKINLTKGKHTLVDDEDFEYLNQFKWYLHSAGYAVTSRDILMHRLIINTPKGKVTDHINRNKLDNRKENLRICTQSINMFNVGKYKHNKSGFRGVSWDKVNKKWRVCIKLYRRQITVGRFTDKETAYNARINAEAQLC